MSALPAWDTLIVPGYLSQAKICSDVFFLSAPTDRLLLMTIRIGHTSAPQTKDFDVFRWINSVNRSPFFSST